MGSHGDDSSAAGHDVMTNRVTENPITGIVSMIHVSDVERSAAFYRLLGFEIGNRVPKTGPPQWAWLYAPGAPDWRRGPNLMLARTGRPLQPEAIWLRCARSCCATD